MTGIPAANPVPFFVPLKPNAAKQYIFQFILCWFDGCKVIAWCQSIIHAVVEITSIPHEELFAVLPPCT